MRLSHLPCPPTRRWRSTLWLIAGLAPAQDPPPPAPPMPTTAAAPAAASRDDPTLAPIVAAAREHLEAERQRRGFPGVSAAFVLPDGRVGEVAVGSQDRDGVVPLLPANRLLSGSIGKTYVAAVALQLVGEGELDLDARVAAVLGDRDWYRGLPNGDTVTLRQLLNHTSGIPDHVWKKAFEQRVLAKPDDPPTPVECLDYIRGDEPLGEPGAKWSYADTNYVLVGLMIEARTGIPFATAMNRRLLEPLGLRDTLANTRRDLPGLANGIASGIAFHRGDTVTDGRYFVNPAFEYCGGGVCSTAADLARWGRALFAGAVVPAKLQGEQRHGVPAAPRVTEAYGLGCFVMQSPLGEAYGHSGFMPGYQAMLAHYPTKELTVALMWNTDAGREVGSPRRGADALAEVLLTASPPKQARDK